MLEPTSLEGMLKFLGLAFVISAVAVPSMDYLARNIADRIVFREEYRAIRNIKAGRPPFKDNQLYFNFMKDYI